MALSIESFEVPDVQPKGFKSALVTPTRDEVRHNGRISFSPDTTISPKSKANENNTTSPNNGNGIGATSIAMSLNLRRVTPDRRSSSQALDGGNRDVNGNLSSAASTTSRVTGKASIFTEATPVMRGGRSKLRARSPTSIERQQKMEDEYYVPGHGADDEVEEEGEEILDDGELPSLRRTGSAGSRSSSRLRRVATVSHRGDAESTGSRKSNLAPPSPQAALAAATAAALIKNANYGMNDDEIEVDIANITKKSKRSNLATPPMDNKDFEQLKVAGFWSQLDDLGTVGSSDTEETSNTRKSQVRVHGGDEEMPNDERKWIRSQTPPKRRDVYDGISQQLEQKQLRWNLIEKAACFRNDHAENDEEHSELQQQQGQHQEDDGDASQHSSNTRDNILKNNTFHTSGTENTRATNATGGTGATGATSTQGSSYQHSDNDEDEGLLGCITAALGTLCGYDSCNKDDNKEKALKIIERDNARKNQQFEAHQKNIESAMEKDERMEIEKADDEKKSHVYAYDDDSIFDEDVAIELQYLSSPSHNTNNSTEVDGFDHDINSQRPADEVDDQSESSDKPTISLSPRSEGGTPLSPGKRKLKLKSVRSLLGRSKSKKATMEEQEEQMRLQEQFRFEQKIRKQKRAEKQEARSAAAETRAVSTSAAAEEEEGEVRSPPRKTLITTTTLSGNEPVAGSFAEVTDAFSSTDEGDKSMEAENRRIPMPSLIHDLDDEEHRDSPRHHSNEKARKEEIPSQNNKSKTSKSDNDEEFQSESATWSANRKNSYLRELADRAKQEYHAKKAAAADVTYDQSAQPTLLPSSRSNTKGAEELTADIKRTDTGVPQGTESAYHADYNSLSPTEKRKFLRLLNSGMSPSKATQAIVEEREVVQRAVLEEENGDDDDDELDSLLMEEEDDDDKGPRERDLPMDETVISTDPPGEVLEGFSGESAELSYRDDAGEDEHLSPSEIGVNNSKSSTSEKSSDVAAIPLVPPIVQAKSSFGSNRGRKNPSTRIHHDHQGEDEEGEDEMEVEARTDINHDQGRNNDELECKDEEVLEADEDEAVDEEELTSPTSDVDLIPYYTDHNSRSFENETNEDSLLLGKDYNRSKKSKLALSSVSNLSVKMPSRRHIEFSSDMRSAMSTIVSPSSRSNGYVHPVPSRDDTFIATPTSPRSPLGGNDERETKSDFAKSSKSLSSALSFIHRSSKWAKLESDIDHSFSRSNDEGYDTPISLYNGGVNAKETGSPASFSSENDAERRSQTPTREFRENNEDFVSPDESEGYAASKAGSMVVSPDTTLSPTSPHDLASAKGTPEQITTVGDIGASPLDSETRTKLVSPSPVYSPSIPHESDDATPKSYNLSAPRVQSPPAQSATLPLMPMSPDEGDESAFDDSTSIMEQSHIMDQSHATIGTSWTTASKSLRKRHKGAASKRLTKAKEAENQAGVKAKGWLGSIREASSTQNQAWDPEKGWMDYSEPETTYCRGENKRIGTLHIPKTLVSKQHHAARQISPNFIAESPDRDVVVRFPSEWEEERKSMSKHDNSSEILASTFQRELDYLVLQDEESLFTSDTATVNTATDVSSLMTHSVAPKRRATSKHKSNDKRKLQATQAKRTGWKESMEAATATVAGSSEAGRRWNYRNGWVEDYVSTDDNSDDVSELTKLTLLEKSHENKFHNSPSEGESIAPSYQLPSVAEGMDEVDSLSQLHDDENNDLSKQNEEKNVDSHEISSIAPEEDSIDSSSSSSKDDPIVVSYSSGGVPVNEPADVSTYNVVHEDVSVPDDTAVDTFTEMPKESTSDVSTKTSEDNFDVDTKFGRSEESKLNENDFYTEAELRQELNQKPSNSKKSLNQWLAKSSNINMKPQDAESEEAVTSREQLTLDSNSQSLSVGPTLDSNDHFDEIEEPSDGFTQDIPVLKERCTDTEKDLFRPSNISESFIHKFSDAEESELIMESFESLDSSDNLWLKQTPSRDAPSIVSENTEDASRPSVSERARAWMRAMEKQKGASEPEEIYFTKQKDPREELKSSPRFRGTVTEEPSDPPQNLDSPSSPSDKAGQKAVQVATRHLISGSRLDAPPTSENKGGSDRPRLEPVNNKANIMPSSGIKEKDVIFHSTAMGIRLKRGEDGLVRVVSVTQATPGSSIKRDGLIEPDDIIREAAGIDLRQPITNSQWGEVVTKIRSAPRPMKFVTTSSSSNAAEKVDKQPVESSIEPKEPKPCLMSGDLSGTICRNESPTSKSSQRNQPERHQILSSVAAAVAKIDSRADHQRRVPTSIAGTDQSSHSSLGSDATDNRPQQPKETHKPNNGFFNRIASCTIPNSSYPSSHNQDQNEVPLSHLAFLRTNPTIVRVKDAASRRYPAICGRPDTIFEEPSDSEKDKDNDESQSHVKRSYPFVSQSNTSSTYSNARSLRTPISASSAAGDNTAFLETLAQKSTVASKPTGNQAQRRSHPNARHRMTEPNGGHKHGRREVEWPDSDTPEYVKDSMDTMSSYSSTFSHSSFQGNKRKKDSVRQAELLAAAKVEAMMDELKHVDSMEQCEI